MDKKTWKALLYNEATVEFKPKESKSPIHILELSVLVNGDEEYVATTYTEASEWLIGVVNNNPYDLLSAADVVAEIVEGILEQDGVTIEDTIKDDTGRTADYQNDGIWSVNGKLFNTLDVSALLKETYIGLSGEEIANKYNKDSEDKIAYLEDSIFERL